MGALIFVVKRRGVLFVSCCPGGLDPPILSQWWLRENQPVDFRRGKNTQNILFSADAGSLGATGLCCSDLHPKVDEGPDIIWKCPVRMPASTLM